MCVQKKGAARPENFDQIEGMALPLRKIFSNLSFYQDRRDDQAKKNKAESDGDTKQGFLNSAASSEHSARILARKTTQASTCLLYTSDAADVYSV